MAKLIKEVLSSRRFYDPIQIGGLELPLHFAFGLHPFCCDLASTDSLESNPGLVLAEEADLAGQSHHSNRIPSQHCQVKSEFFYMPLAWRLSFGDSWVWPLWVRL